MAIDRKRGERGGIEAWTPGKLVKEVWGGADQGEDGTNKTETREASGLGNCSVVTAGVRAAPRSTGQEQLAGKEAVSTVEEKQVGQE